MKNSLKYDFFPDAAKLSQLTFVTAHPHRKKSQTSKKLSSCCLSAVKKVPKCKKLLGRILPRPLGPLAWDHACDPQQSATFTSHSPKPSPSNNHRPRLIFPSTIVAREPHRNKIPPPLAVPSNFRLRLQTSDLIGKTKWHGLFYFPIVNSKVHGPPTHSNTK